ncbi:extracellular solute-binding protein [Mycetocola lacteus]|uniref:Extracellular solute-binding protein n=1 Tax=Mycetocola lacteus TaxID=76637 RepID=A0A3L7AH01_9MICO|nr:MULTISPECIES: extracellular solute-binding protein [Mycetocola]MCS4276712.1 raffinose/stachyose/melibiose transport system substrate-binding protein [Mycetocola sp. BIGb0189]RLP79756.1 extracellular solute-binding protein [Mycetocola lacteus]
MKRRTLTSVMATAAILALTLTGCGSAGNSVPEGSATMWTLAGGTEPIINDSVARWNKAHESESIKLDSFANDAYKTKVRTAIGAGEGPTFIYSWGGGVLRDYVEAGQVEDLSGFLAENPEVADRYLKSVLPTGQVDGKTYALPNNANTPVMIYFNKKVFEEAGVTPPKTWDDLMSLVKVFKDKGIAPFSLGGQSKWPNLMWLQYLTDRIGGPEVFQAIIDGKPDAWSNPAVLAALTKIQELVDAGGFVTGFSSIAADSGADRALLHTGKAAMLMQGAWAYPTFKTDAPQFVKDGDLGYIPFPAVTGGVGDPQNIVGNPSNFWSVSSKATPEQKKAALAYLKDGMFDAEYTKQLIDTGSVPVVTGVEDQLKKSEDADFLTFTYNLASNAPHFQLSWDQALPSTQGDAMLTNLDQIFLKKITPEEFATNMNKTLGK